MRVIASDQKLITAPYTTHATMGTMTLWNSSRPSTVRHTIAKLAPTSILARDWYLRIPWTSPRNMPDIVFEKSQAPDAAKIHAELVLLVK